MKIRPWRGWAAYAAETAGLALTYFLLARLGFLCAIPPGTVTLIWPASGLALAAALCLGRRAALGTALGSLVVNLWVLGSLALPATALGCALATAAGSTLQALAGAGLYARLGERWERAGQWLGGIGLFALAATLSCLLAASVGVSVLVAAGLVSGADFGLTWGVWYLGDWLGMVAFAPVLVYGYLALVGGGKPGPGQVGSSIFGVGLGLSLVVFTLLWTLETRAIAAVFAADSEVGLGRIEESIGFNQYALDAVNSLYTSVDQVDREGFRTFVQPFLSGEYARHGLQALSWNPYVRAPARPSYEAAVRREGIADFRFTERDGAGNLVPARERADYVPVLFIEPLAKNRAALGYDVSSNPLRLKAITRAHDTGEISATAPIMLVQEAGQQQGFLVFRPIFRKDLPADTPAARAAALRGFAVGVFRIGDLVEAGLARSAAEMAGHEVYVFDATPGEEQLLHVHRPGQQGSPGEGDTGLSLAALKTGIYRTASISVGGRPWLVIDRPVPGGLSGLRSWVPWGVLAGGLAFTLLTLVFYLRLRRAVDDLGQAHEHLQQNQAQLLQSEKMASIGQLAAGVAHEINNPMGFIHSNLNRLAEYSADLAELNRSYAALEQAAEQGTAQEIAAAREAVSSCRRRLETDYLLADLPALVAESLEGAVRVRRIVENLRDFSHASTAEKVLADLNTGIESTLHIVWNELKYKVEVKKDYGTLPLVWCYPQELNQVFMNLLVNAAQAIEGRGEISIRTFQNAGHACVEIADNGKGMSAAVQQHLFEPFFTTKPVGQGTGLGLSMSYRIVVEHHGGRIEVTSREGVGSRFTVMVPLAGNQPPAS